MKKILALTMAVIMSISVFSGCQASATAKPAEDKILKLAQDGEIRTADPQKDTEWYTIAMNCFDTLVVNETLGQGKSQLAPALAESWEVSADGLVYTFKLRQGVKFHNGEIFKADDIVFTFERMLTPETQALNGDFIDAIDGAYDMMEGTETTLRGLKVIDDYTIQMTLAAPFAPFLANIATPGVAILNRKATEAAGDQFGIDPKQTIGTGPFVFDRWDLNSEQYFVPFKDYWRGASELEGLSIRIVGDPETMRMMFENGELDEFDCDNARSQIPYFESSEKYKDWIITGNRVGVYYYSINANIEPFDDVKVRLALQRAIDRQEILDTLYFGKGELESGILPVGVIGNNPDLPDITYDPEEAKRLLAEAGLPDGFEMTITQVTDSAATLKLNEVVQAQLAKVGIIVTIEQMDEASWYGVRAEGKLGTYTTSWSADFNDPDNFIYTFFAPQNTIKRSFNYKNTAVSERVVAARAIVDPEARIKEYQELEKILIQEEAAWVPLFSLEHLWIVNPRVKNYQPLWNGWSGNCYYGISIENQ